MSVYEAMKWGRYLHPTHGMASNRPHTGQNPGYQCDNYWLYTGHLLRCMKDAGEPYRETLTPTVRAFFEATRVKPGLFSRFPGRAGEDVSQDEILGMSYLCLRMGFRSLLDEILDRGFRTNWCFNVAEPAKWDERYYYARHPYFKPFLLECWHQLNPAPRGSEADEEIMRRERNTFNLGHALQWAGVLFKDEKVGREDSDGKQRIWLQCDVLRGSHWITDLEIKRWQRNVPKYSFSGPRDFMATYFGATNPLTLATPERFP